tara:strand:- start:255 stop:1064 length:810 start_codon:yes stop_codon:yes gene_type:complete
MLDQFYTNENIAIECIKKLQDKVDIKKYDIHMEPSAGTGSFYNLMDISKRIGIDIDSKCEGVINMDFLNYQPNVDNKYLVLGNPPFGKNCSMAIKFFNKAAEFSDCIAFIVPRTFKRVSIQNQLNLNFTLHYNEDLPLKPCCFTPSMNAKCCFQIWIKTNVKREKIIYDKTHKDFTFSKLGSKDGRGQPTPPKNVDFVMKAYGSNCGEIKESELEELRPKSWHWIKANINKDELKKRFESLDYSISKDTVRQDSIGQQEVIYLYKMKYD